MRKHIVPNDDAGEPPLVPDLTGDLSGEVRIQRFEAGLVRHRGEVACGLDSEGTHASILERTEQDAVVAAELDNERTRRCITRYKLLGQLLEMGQERWRRGRRVQIVSEQDVRADHRAELDEPTRPTPEHIQRV